MAEILSLKEFHTPEVLGYIRPALDAHNRRAYVGPSLFPSRNLDTLTWEYIVAAKNRPIPVMAEIKAINAQSRVGIRASKLEKVSGEIPSIAWKLPVDAKTLLKLKHPRSESSEFQQAVDEVYDDLESCVSAVAARIEWLRWKALTTPGAFTYSADGVTLSINFGIPSSNIMSFNGTGFGGVAFSEVATADVLKDLMTALDKVEEATGVRPGRAFISRKLAGYLMRNEKLVTQAFGSDFSGKLFTRTEFQRVLDEFDLPEFSIIETKVQTVSEDGATLAEERLLPEGLIIFLPPASFRVSSNLPPGTLGETLFGPTAEELLSDTAFTQEGPRIWGDVWVEGKDPGVMWTKAVANAFPTFPGADVVAQFTAF